MRLGLSFTTAGSWLSPWPIGVPEKTRSETRPRKALPQGSGLGVATHPVAQLSFRIIPTAKTLQQPHRPRPSRALYFHTIYDGDGRRVKKYVPGTGETTIFVYDAAGKQIAEYSTIVADSSSAKVSYLTNDHLGSPRINTDVAGAVTARHDYHPFGEEVTVGRTSHSEYTPDSVRKQFTGYERDGETDLDFAQARLLQNGHGRFVQADPYNIIFEKEKGRSQKEKAKIFMRFVAQRYARTFHIDHLALVVAFHQATFAHVGALEVGPGQVGPGDISAAEIGARKIGAFQIGIAQIAGEEGYALEDTA